MHDKETFEQALETRGSFVAPAKGESMRPLIRPGRDLVEITRKGPERCKQHDAALYLRDGKYVLHRVLQVRPDDYVMAGDHQIEKETGVTDAQILGVLSAVIRNGKRVAVTDRGYRFYVRVWCGLFPVRRAIRSGKAAALRAMKRKGGKRQ